MNVRMYSAAREATTRARNVASAIQQVQRQVNDDNKDIAGKVDKDEQIRAKRKAELELFTAKNAKELAAKQEKLTQIQAAVGLVQTLVAVTVSVIKTVKEIKDSKKKGEVSGKGDDEGGGGSGPEGSNTDVTKIGPKKDTPLPPVKKDSESPPTPPQKIDPKDVQQGDGTSVPKIPPSKAKGVGGDGTSVGGKGNPNVTREEKGGAIKQNKGEAGTGAGIEGGLKSAGDKLSKFGDAIGFRGIGGKNNYTAAEKAQIANGKYDPNDHGPLSGGAISAIAKLVEQLVKILGQNVKQADDGFFSDIANKAKAIGHALATGKDENGKDLNGFGKALSKAAQPIIKTGKLAIDTVASGAGKLLGGAASGIGFLTGGFADVGAYNKALTRNNQGINGREGGSSEATKIADQAEKTGKLSPEQLKKFKEAVATDLINKGADPTKAAAAADKAGKNLLNQVAAAAINKAGGVDGQKVSVDAKTGGLSLTGKNGASVEIGQDLAQQIASGGAEAQAAVAVVGKAGGLADGLAKAGIKDAVLGADGSVQGKLGDKAINLGADLADRVSAGNAAGLSVSVSQNDQGEAKVSLKAGDKEVDLSDAQVAQINGAQAAGLKVSASATGTGTDAKVTISDDKGNALNLNGDQLKQIAAANGLGLKAEFGSGTDGKSTVSFKTAGEDGAEGKTLTGDQIKQLTDLKAAGADIKGVSVGEDGKLSVQLGAKNGNKTLGEAELANFSQTAQSAGGASNVTIDKNGKVGGAINAQNADQAAIVSAVNTLNAGLDALHQGNAPAGLKIDLTGATASADGKSINLADGRSLSLDGLNASAGDKGLKITNADGNGSLTVSNSTLKALSGAGEADSKDIGRLDKALSAGLTLTQSSAIGAGNASVDFKPGQGASAVTLTANGREVGLQTTEDIARGTVSGDTLQKELGLNSTQAGLVKLANEGVNVSGATIGPDGDVTLKSGATANASFLKELAGGGTDATNAARGLGKISAAAGPDANLASVSLEADGRGRNVTLKAGGETLKGFDLGSIAHDNSPVGKALIENAAAGIQLGGGDHGFAKNALGSIVDEANAAGAGIGTGDNRTGLTVGDLTSTSTKGLKSQGDKFDQRIADNYHSLGLANVLTLGLFGKDGTVHSLFKSARDGIKSIGSTKSSEDLVGNLRDQAVDELAGKINGDKELNTAIRNGDRTAATARLQALGLGSEADKLIQTTGNGIAITGLKDALKDRVQVSQNQGEGGTTFKVSVGGDANLAKLISGANGGSEVGSLTVGKNGSLSASGPLQLGGIVDGIKQERLDAIAAKFSGIVGNDSNPLAVKADDITLNENGELASVRVGGRQLSASQYAEELTALGGRGNITGKDINDIVKGAVGSSVNALSSGGKSGLSPAAQAALQNLQAQGIRTDNASITLGADGSAKISVGDLAATKDASGKDVAAQKAVSFSIDKNGNITTGDASAPNGGGSGGAVSSLLQSSQGVSATDADKKGAQFVQNQSDADKLRDQINASFSKLGGLVGGKVQGLDLTYTEGQLTGAQVRLNNNTGFDLNINQQTGQFAVSNLSQLDEQGNRVGALDPNEGFNAKAIGSLLGGLRKNGLSGSDNKISSEARDGLTDKLAGEVQTIIDGAGSVKEGRAKAEAYLQQQGFTAEQAKDSLYTRSNADTGRTELAVDKSGLNDALKDRVADPTGGIAKILAGFGAGDISITNTNHLGKIREQDKNAKNDNFDQEGRVRFTLGQGDKKVAFDAGIAYDSNGSVSLSLGNLSPAQKQAIQDAVASSSGNPELQKAAGALLAKELDGVINRGNPGAAQNSELRQVLERGGNAQDVAKALGNVLGPELATKVPGLGQEQAKNVAQHALGGQDAGSTARNLALLDASTDPKFQELINKSGVTRDELTASLATSLKKFGVAETDANAVARSLISQKQGGGFQLASINTGSALATATPQDKDKIGRELLAKSPNAQNDAIRIFSQSLGGGNRGVDAIRGVGGRILQDSELTDTQRANRDQAATNTQNAERQIIEAANGSGNSVRFATLQVRALLGEDVANGLIGSQARGGGKEGTVADRGKEFRALVSAGELDKAQGVLDEALKASGLAAGSISIADLTSQDGTRLLSGKEAVDKLGGLDVKTGYDGRTASIQTIGGEGKGIQSVPRSVQQAIYSDAFRGGNDSPVKEALLGSRVGQAIDAAGNDEALTNALESGDRAAAVKALTGLLGAQGLGGGSAELIAQRLISTPDPSTGELTLKKGAGPVNQAISDALASGSTTLNGKPIGDLTSQLRTAVNGNYDRDPNSGQLSPSALAERNQKVNEVLQGAGVGGANLQGKVVERSDGTRTVSGSGAGNFGGALQKQLPSNEKSGGQKFLDAVSVGTKGLAHALEAAMPGLQNLKKALEELQEIRVRKEAAEKQYQAALEYAQKVGVTFGNAGDGAQAASESNDVAAAAGVNAKGGVPGYESPQLAAMAKQGHKDGDKLQGPDGKDAKQPGSPSQPVQSSLEEQKAATSEELEKVAGDANFANVAVLLGQNPGQLIQQAQQMEMLQQLTQTIQHLQSPFGNPVQEMQRFVDSLKAKQNQSIPPTDGAQGP